MEPLEGLADIAVPAPVSCMPQTWGWAVLGVVLLGLSLWAFVRWRRRRERNRYRREALAELAHLSSQDALAVIPPLLKRVALSAWPRSEVAALSGQAWVSFLRAHGPFPEEAARLLDDIEYQPRAQGEAIELLVKASRLWIEKHVRA
jgi:hypothetical protein